MSEPQSKELEAVEAACVVWKVGLPTKHNFASVVTDMHANQLVGNARIF